MHNMKNLALVAALALSLQACQQSAKDENKGTTTIVADTTLKKTANDQQKGKSGKLSSEETAFIEKAAIGGMMEVEMGNLTTQKSKSKTVLDFARRMVADHNKINAELAKIAAAQGIKLPGALPAAEQSHLAAMRQMQANEYDQNYMDMMVGDHSKTLDLFNAATRFENPELKTFAVNTRPVIQEHQKVAIGIDSVIKVKKPDNRGDDLPNVDKKHKN